jgi:hypothetical protein
MMSDEREASFHPSFIIPHSAFNHSSFLARHFNPRAVGRIKGVSKGGDMSEHGKCPMGNHPWLATFFALAFVLVFAAHKLGLL